MIQLLYSVIFAEMVLILTLLFKTPLRKIVIFTLDRVKRGRGPVVVKTVGGTIFIVLLSSVYGVYEVQSRNAEGAPPNPTDQVLMAWHMLEASLMGFLLFLALMIDRLHHYIRELRMLRKAMEAAKKHTRGLDDGKNGNLDVKAQEVGTMKDRIKYLESENEAKAKQASVAEAEVETLRKRSEGFLMEYDRLLEDNQNLRNQLESINQTTSQSEGKKSI